MVPFSFTTLGSLMTPPSASTLSWQQLELRKLLGLFDLTIVQFLYAIDFIANIIMYMYQYIDRFDMIMNFRYNSCHSSPYISLTYRIRSDHESHAISVVEWYVHDNGIFTTSFVPRLSWGKREPGNDCVRMRQPLPTKHGKLFFTRKTYCHRLAMVPRRF